MATPNWATTPSVRRRMQRQKRRDTEAELALRRLLHARGLRYRVHVRPEPAIRRVADVVFPRLKVAVFVDGCFWHGCPEHATWPKSNAAEWRSKIEKNRARDAETTRQLEHAGWIVVRVWEHQPAEQAADRIEVVVREARRRRTVGAPP